MSDENQIAISSYARIPFSEIWFETSRSSGPGGQNVNKVETRAVLCFDIGKTESLSRSQRGLVERGLANRINKENILRVASQSERTQAGNRRKAQERFQQLLVEVLTPRAPRRPTKPSAATKRRRLEGKRRRADLKKSRRVRDDD